MAGLSDVLETVRAEDYVEYFLFPSMEGQKDLANFMECMLSNIKSIIGPNVSNYIWHKDEFHLVIRGLSELPPVDHTAETLPPHFYGVTHFGENIEDEWFIVHLLAHLTRNIPELIARVADSDGEFILIEAADYLPKWASPELCDKRVFLYRGEVHIVPPEGEDDVITVAEALSNVRTRDDTVATDRLQAAIAARINGYPEKVSELVHQTNAYVPCAVAALLEARPSLVAPAITAFCHRDHIDTRVCRAMRYFPPETCVMTRVKMTRCLYAMLLHHKYTPDRKTGWQLPPTNSPDYNSHSLGIKLACGFEILVSQSKEKADTEDVDNDRSWLTYKKSLSNKGYFKGELEGSKEYRRLEGEAKQFYRQSVSYAQPSTGSTVLGLLDSLDYDLEEMKRRSLLLPPPDEDSWLEMSSEELDRMLTERYGAAPSMPSSELPHHLASFLDKISGLAGVEHPTQPKGVGGPTPPVRRRKKSRTTGTTGTAAGGATDDDNNRVSFDPDSFSCALNNILEFIVPEDKWDLESDESGMSDYEDEAEMDLSKKRPSAHQGEQSELKQYMDQMDRELAATTIDHSFVKKQPSENKGPQGMEDSFSDIESFQPVDIDMNALRNILRSYEEEMGGAGPASNLLGPMGLRLDKHDK